MNDIQLKETHRRFYIPTFHEFYPGELYLQWQEDVFERVYLSIHLYFSFKNMEQFDSPLETQLGKSLYQ